MKAKPTAHIANLAIGLAAIMVSYTALPTCWGNNTLEHCRDAVSPPTTLQIGDVECSLDSDYYKDDVIGAQGAWYTQSPAGYCRGNTTGCFVAYDCPDEYNVVMSYFLFSDLVTWQVGTWTLDCLSCGS